MIYPIDKRMCAHFDVSSLTFEIKHDIKSKETPKAFLKNWRIVISGN